MNLKEIKQAISNLSYKDFERFSDWFEELCDERWAEEIENDPLAQAALRLGNFIMSKPDPDQFLVDLHSGQKERKQKEEDNNGMQSDAPTPRR